MARHVATDAHACPNDRAAHWIRRGSSEQGANVCTGEIDAEVLKKMTLPRKLNTDTLNLNRNSAHQLFDEMF